MTDCCCGSADKVRILCACSGAAYTGFVADNVSPRPARLRMGRMTCLAAVAATLSGFVESARAAGGNVVVDGCPMACGKSIFDSLGIPYRHLTMTDFGVEKGRTVITPESIAKTAFAVAEELAGGHDSTAL